MLFVLAKRPETCDVDCGVGCNLVVWKRATPSNRMREILTYGSVGGVGRVIADSTRTAEREIAC